VLGSPTHWPTPLTGSDPKLERRVLDLFQVLLDLPAGERVAWVKAHSDIDSPLRTRLTAMLAGDRLANMRTGGVSDMIVDERLPERIGAYRITGLIGQGGMGAVYRGERMRGDFDHVAAIKVVRPGALSDALVERFQRERQTLASLSHPNIARLFDGGATDQGDPYIVMEYVDGVPLGTWIETQAASKAERTRLLLDICAAVGFAHQNLIVHRDITPSNILVANNGTAKLIDFGIARPPVADVDTAPSPRKSLAGLSLTPGYAAPERVAGKAATTLSDVYSLGVLLDRLLKNEQDADLTAIIAQASAIDPADRYPSVDALADDVKAWRDGYVVAARKGGKRYAALKFVNRHRVGIAASGLAFLLLISALFITLIANARAVAARNEAEVRFAQTRAIAKTLLFETFDEISRTPGSTKARAALARTGLMYLDALAESSDAPLELRIETGRGYTRLAEVVGGGQESQLGKFEDANALLAKSEAILKPAFATAPDDPAVVRAWAILRLKQAEINLSNNNRPLLARQQAREVQTLLAASIDAESVQAMIRAIETEGHSFVWVDEYAKGQIIHAKGEQYINAKPQIIQNDARVLAARAANLRQMGEALHKLKQTALTRTTLDRSISFGRKALKADPENPDLVRRLIAALRYASVVHRTNYRDPEARAAIDEAVQLARRQRERDPADVGAMKIFALVAEVQAQIFGDQKKFAESYALGDEVIATHRQMVALAGNAPGALRSMTAALSTHGGNHYTGGDFVGACRIWRRTLDNWETLDRRGVMTDTDRKNGWPEVLNYYKKSCLGGPPRAGMGPEL
jgi:eukaryotic-like serine/threonine-protein kinase